jgi:hypothetical protein
VRKTLKVFKQKNKLIQEVSNSLLYSPRLTYSGHPVNPRGFSTQLEVLCWMMERKWGDSATIHTPGTYLRYFFFSDKIDSYVYA